MTFTYLVPSTIRQFASSMCCLHLPTLLHLPRLCTCLHLPAPERERDQRQKVYLRPTDSSFLSFFYMHRFSLLHYFFCFCFVRLLCCHITTIALSHCHPVPSSSCDPCHTVSSSEWLLRSMETLDNSGLLLQAHSCVCLRHSVSLKILFY